MRPAALLASRSAAFLESLRRGGALAGDRPRISRCACRCDESNNPPRRGRRGGCVVDIARRARPSRSSSSSCGSAGSEAGVRAGRAGRGRARPGGSGLMASSIAPRPVASAATSRSRCCRRRTPAAPAPGPSLCRPPGPRSYAGFSEVSGLELNMTVEEYSAGGTQRPIAQVSRPHQMVEPRAQARHRRPPRSRSTTPICGPGSTNIWRVAARGATASSPCWMPTGDRASSGPSGAACRPNGRGRR